MKLFPPKFAFVVGLLAISSLQTLAHAQSGRRSYIPAHQRQTVVVQQPTGAGVVVQEGQVVEPGEEIQLGEIRGELAEPGVLEFWDGGCDGGCGGNCDGGCAATACGDGCGSCGVGTCRGCLIPCPWISFDNIEWMGGVNAFTGPTNRGETGSFGFYEAMNWGAPLPCIGCGELGVQLGARAVQANLSGAEFTTNQRDQLFLTGGLFRRVDWGMQGGVVVDYMHEDWYAEVDLIQIRGELSWLYPNCHELGFFFTAATESDQAASMVNNTLINETFESNDLYAFFYRYRHNRGDCRLFGGFSGESDGLIGSDFQWAFNDCWAMEGGFTYLLPEESTTARGHEQEAWNVALGLVWYPGRRSALGTDYYRPLFNVADNGTFLVERR